MSTLLALADAFAAHAHRNQLRKYGEGPYIAHPRAVSALVKQFGGTEDMQCAALLHDVIEDCGVTYETLRMVFGPVIADMVQDLSDEYTKTAYPDMNRALRKKLEAQRLAKCSAEVQTIKVCDLCHNTISIASKAEGGYVRMYLAEKANQLDQFDLADPRAVALAREQLKENGYEYV